MHKTEGYNNVQVFTLNHQKKNSAASVKRLSEFLQSATQEEKQGQHDHRILAFPLL